jgi:steroid delta-isomerase-like uncharacterized protein
MGSSQDAVSIARENIDAFNQGDRERFKANVAPDTVYREFATGREVRGVEEVTTTSWGWRDAFPDAHGEITNAFGSGDQVVLQIVWTGTQKGDLVGPMGTIPATGKQVRIPATQVLRIVNGKIASTDHYFDLMTMLVQLGAVPQPQQVGA